MQSILQKYRAKLYHAINLRDFEAYCKTGFLLCREDLEAEEADFTRFSTDSKDREIDVWNRVFGNLKDIGSYFWSKDDSVPNAYGPITLAFNHRVWPTLTDLTITSQTVTNGKAKALTAADIDESFVQNGQYYNLKDGLSAIEINASNRRIPLSDLAYILVDNISVEGRALIDRVQATTRSYPNLSITDKQIKSRIEYKQGRTARMAEFVALALELKGATMGVYGDGLIDHLPEKIRGMYQNLPPPHRNALSSWLAYTYCGTLRIL